MKRTLFAGIACGILPYLTPSFAEAQRPSTKDTIVSEHILPAIVVTAEDAFMPKKTLSIITGENPAQELYIRTPGITSLIPGLSNMVYKNIPLGIVPYRYGVPFIGRMDLNHSLTPSFSSFPTEQIEGTSTAITPSSDIPLEIRTLQRKNDDSEDFSLSAQAQQLSGSIDHSRNKFRLAGSAQALGTPRFLPDYIEDPLKILGQGGRVHFITEFGEERSGEAPYKTKLLSLEAYGMNLVTDLSNQFNIDRFQEHDQQGLVIVHSEYPIKGINFETTNSLQFGLSDLKIDEGTADSAKAIHQDITLFTSRAAINYPRGSFALAFNDLQKTNTLGNEKGYSVLQFSVDRADYLPFGLGLRFNGRADFIGNSTRPIFSFYSSLEQKVSGLTFGISGAYLNDAIIHELLGSPLLDLSPSPNTEVQNIIYGEARLEARLGSHVLQATAGKKEMDMPLYAENERIEGFYYNAGYSWSNKNLFLTINASLRSMQMYRGGKIYPVPGSPREELKIITGFNGRNFSIGTSMAMQGSSQLPFINEAGVEEFAGTGRRVILNPYFSVKYKPLSLGLTVVNALEVMEDMGAIKNFNNVLAIYGKNRKTLEMPGFVYATLRLEF